MAHHQEPLPGHGKRPGGPLRRSTRAPGPRSTRRTARAAAACGMTRVIQVCGTMP